MQKFIDKARPQGVLAVFGVFMLVLANVGYLASSTEAPNVSNDSSSGTLKVEPAKGVPKPLINSLQGAKNLQSQGSQSLQTPVGDQLQPNAKTGNFGSTNTVQ